MAADLISTKGQVVSPVSVRKALGLKPGMRVNIRYGFARGVIAALTMIASLENAVIGERDAVLAATAHLAQGWDFSDALHHALSAGCDGFATFDNASVKRAGRLPDASPAVVSVQALHERPKPSNRGASCRSRWRTTPWPA